MRTTSRSAWITWIAYLLLCTLSACGGGSSGGNDSPASGQVVLQFSNTTAQATSLEGLQTNLVVNGTLQYGQGVGDFYLFVEADERLVMDAQISGGGNNFSLSLLFAQNLPAGDYPITLTLHACNDAQCSREIGTPVQLPITLHIEPNIQVQTKVTLSRTGREPAPQVVLPVTVPAAAGDVSIRSASGLGEDVNAVFDGTSLRVTTKQSPAGTYQATVVLQSNTNERYTRTVYIDYTVSPPPGGEQPLVIDNPSRSLSILQGERSVQLVHVTRPTWTDTWNAPVIAGATPQMASIRDLGNDNYEVTLNTAGLPFGTYSVDVQFSAGPQSGSGASGAVTFSVSVEAVFSVASGLTPIELSSASTAADLARSINIAMIDGTTARWTASSTSPYLQIANPSGQTGIDALRVSVDPNVLLQSNERVQSLPMTLSVDVPGSLSRTYELAVANNITQLKRSSPATMVGASGRVYVEGIYSQTYPDTAWRDRLRITGATLAQANHISDRRFFGDALVLALDLTDMVPGQPVVISIDSQLKPSQVQLQVLSPLRSNTTYQALPFDAYRPALYAPGLSALYFAGTDVIYRWAHAVGSWTLSQTGLAGLVDVAPSPDDTVLYANTNTQVLALNPATLSQQGAGAFVNTYTPSWQGFDASGTRAAHGLLFAADGRALASIISESIYASHKAAWICSAQDAISGTASLTTQPSICDPTSDFSESHTSRGFGLTRSVNGHSVVAIGANGMRLHYRGADRVWSELTSLSPGDTVVAINDAGTRSIRGDGTVMEVGDILSGNLNNTIPMGYTVGGYGLSTNGRYALVYGYHVSGTGAAERASDATLWVIDLGPGPVAFIDTPVVLATELLPQPVGCTSTLVSGESCVHRAAITVAPGQGTAFVLGPRGVAAVPLPNSAAEAQTQSAKRNTLSVKRGLDAPARNLRRSARRVSTLP